MDTSYLANALPITPPESPKKASAEISVKATKCSLPQRFGFFSVPTSVLKKSAQFGTLLNESSNSAKSETVSLTPCTTPSSTMSAENGILEATNSVKNGTIAEFSATHSGNITENDSMATSNSSPRQLTAVAGFISPGGIIRKLNQECVPNLHESSLNQSENLETIPLPPPKPKSTSPMEPSLNGYTIKPTTVYGKIPLSELSGQKIAPVKKETIETLNHREKPTRIHVKTPYKQAVKQPTTMKTPSDASTAEINGMDLCKQNEKETTANTSFEPTPVRLQYGQFRGLIPVRPKPEPKPSSYYGQPPGNLGRLEHLSQLLDSIKTKERDSSSSSSSYGSPFNTSGNSFISAPVVFSTENRPLTLFFTKIYCFSNHFHCERLEIDEVKYMCTEQYYMYYKAHIFGDKQSALLIMRTRDPKVMKKLAEDVENFDQNLWFPISVQIMVIANQRKYEQNPELRRELFSTADTELVEASPTDTRWGVALSIDSPDIRDKSRWMGLNIMGRLLTKLRERLLKRPEFEAEWKEIMNKN
ncbi:N-glycosidase [Ditylenchus destructor]|nr:N-glycosidase [Ditylenchus destructor]